MTCSKLPDIEVALNTESFSDRKTEKKSLHTKSCNWAGQHTEFFFLLGAVG